MAGPRRALSFYPLRDTSSVAMSDTDSMPSLEMQVMEILVRKGVWALLGNNPPLWLLDGQVLSAEGSPEDLQCRRHYIW